MARHSRLFDEALTRFQEEARHEYRDSKDLHTLKSFLSERVSPQDAKVAAEDLSKRASKKYSGNKVIPQKWITTILDNISIFIQVGDYATTSAPESVGLAWYAVRLTLKAIEGNYELYNLFGTGLSSISEIMIIIQHYDEFYDKRGGADRENAGDVLKHLFDTIIETYMAVLKFSFSVKMHLSGGVRDKIGHAIGGLLGFAQAKFQGQLDAIDSLKGKILVDSNVVFQEQALDSLDVTQKKVQDIDLAVKRIEEFQPQLQVFHKEQMDELEKLSLGVKGVHDKLDDIAARTKGKTRWEIAVDQYEEVRGVLLSLTQDTRKVFLDLAASRFPGTCEWVFKQAAYRAWVKESGTFLCISGYAGAGKSTLLSVIANKRSRATRDILLYAACGGPTTRNAGDVYVTILAQLHALAHDIAEGAENASLLEASNKAVHDFLASEGHGDIKSPKQPTTQEQHDPPGFVNTFMALTQSLGLHTLMVLDEVDLLAQKESRRFSKDLGDLLRRFRHRSVLSDRVTQSLRVLVGSSEPFLVDDQAASSKDPAVIRLSHNYESDHGNDFKRMIYGSLKTVPGLSEDDIEYASREIMLLIGHDDYRFSYLHQAMKVMCEPSLPSVSARLQKLPEAGGRSRYDAELLRIGPDYARLLQTALTWCLLGDVEPQAEVIMDDFNQIYRKRPDGYAKWQDSFPPLSSVDLDRLTVLVGPFLRLRYGDDDSWRVVVPNKKSVAEYCFAAPNDGSSHDDGVALCAKCQSNVTPSIPRIFVSEKEGHLDLAITCLTHVNNELFSWRAQLFVDKKEEYLLFKRAEELGLKTHEELLQLAMSEFATGKSHLDRASVEDKGRFPVRDLEEWDESDDDSMDDEDREVVRHRIPATRSKVKRKYWDDSRCTATLDDVKAPAHDDDDKDGEDQSEDLGDAKEPPARYEVQYWPYHLGQAEDRWSAEERSGSAKWAALFAKLDQLVDESTLDNKFHCWQQRYQNASTGPFTVRDNWRVLNHPRKPLHVACYLGLASWVEHLLKNGAKVSEVSGNCNAIQAAASSRLGRRPALLELLLKAGADVNSETDIAPPAFHMWLASDCTSKTVDLMIQHGADPAKVSTLTGETALHHFARRGTEVATLDAIISHGGDINAATRDGYTPLHLLLSRNKVPEDLLEAFVTKYKADVNAELPHNSTRPLHLAARRGDWNTLEILLKSEIVEIDDEDNDGNTALQVAAMHGHHGCVSTLKYGSQDGKCADLEHRNAQGMTALHQAAWFGNQFCVETLIREENGADPLKTDDRNATPLFYACMSKEEDAAKKIMDRLCSKDGISVAEINKPNVDAKTPLRQASLRGLEVVDSFIQAAKNRSNMSGLGIDMQDIKKGMSALHCAARYGVFDVVNQLLQAGADVTLKDAKGRTALTHALDSWNRGRVSASDVKKVLSSLMEWDPRGASASPEVAATCAVHGSTELLKKLHSHGADLTLRDQFGWTPLELAARFQHKDTEAFLRTTYALPSCWVSNSSKRVTNSENGLSFVSATAKPLCLSADKPLPASLTRYYFEIKVILKESSPPEESSKLKPPPLSIAIGFGTSPAAAFTFPGETPRGFAASAKSVAYSSSGSLLKSHPAYKSDQNKEHEYGTGVTVGCGVDLDENIALFTKNGKKLNLEFAAIQGRLYPLLGVCGAGRVEVQTNFRGSFEWEAGNGREWRGEAFTDTICFSRKVTAKTARAHHVCKIAAQDPTANTCMGSIPRLSWA
ncbi:hypothetical protein QBC43DRAFT_362141 [Cladorrhinum sp. PSN259]|nr:hypothetical protein QBC43DRAFT_362141 [Cladorrhinum sp. PSN259]